MYNDLQKYVNQLSILNTVIMILQIAKKVNLFLIIFLFIC